MTDSLETTPALTLEQLKKVCQQLKKYSIQPRNGYYLFLRLPNGAKATRTRDWFLTGVRQTSFKFRPVDYDE